MHIRFTTKHEKPFSTIFTLRSVLFDFQNNDRLRGKERAKISQFSSIQHFMNVVYKQLSSHGISFPSSSLLLSQYIVIGSHSLIDSIALSDGYIFYTSFDPLHLLYIYIYIYS